MNGIGRLSQQFLAPSEASSIAGGPKPGDASGAQTNQDLPADFGGHLANLAQQEIKTNEPEGNSSDLGAPPSASSRRGFLATADTAGTAPLSATASVPGTAEATPGDPTVYGAGMIESLSGSRPQVLREAGHSPGAGAKALPLPDNRQSRKTGIERGVAAAVVPVHGLPRSQEKPIAEANSFAPSLLSRLANNTGLASVRPRDLAHASAVSKEPLANPNQVLLENGVTFGASEMRSLAAGAAAGVTLTAATPDSVSAEIDKAAGQLTAAAVRIQAGKNSGSDRVRAPKPEPEQIPLANFHADGDLEIGAQAFVKITGVDLETHLVPTKALSPAGQLAVLGQVSSHGPTGGSAMPHEIPPQIIAKPDLDVAGVGRNVNSSAHIFLAEPIGSHGSANTSTDRIAASVFTESGPLSPVALSSAGQKSAASSQSFSRASVGGSALPKETQPHNAISDHEAGGSGQQVSSLVEREASDRSGDASAGFGAKPVVSGPGQSTPSKKVSQTGPTGADLALGGARPRENSLAKFLAKPIADHGSGGISADKVATTAVNVPGQAIPAGEVSPALQLAGSIAAASDFGAEAAPVQPGRTIEAVAAAAQPASRVQILRLQLEPENLGTVTVRMRLTGSRLELQVEAARPETARLVANDKELLRGKLQSDGYMIDTLIIRATDLTPSPTGLGADPGASGHEQSTGYANGGTTAHDQHSMRDDKPKSHPIPADDDTKEALCIRPADGELIL